jgi:WD40 repeat protein
MVEERRRATEEEEGPPPLLPSSETTSIISREETLLAHDDRVWSIAFEPNRNELLATCSSDKTVKIWKREEKKIIDGDEEEDDENGDDKVTTTTGKKKKVSFRCACTLDGVHERTIRSVSWSPCGRYLASASFDATVAVYQRVDDEEDEEEEDVKFECVAALEGHENEVKSCAWSPSGSLLATCGRDKSVWIWESAPGNHFECVAVLHGHTQDVKKVKWHETEDVLYSASYDDTVKTWKEDLDGDDWSCSGTTKAHESTVWDLTQERVKEGGRFATVSDDGWVKIWKAGGALKTEISGSNSSSSNSNNNSKKEDAAPLECSFRSGHDRPILCVDWLGAANTKNSERKSSECSGKKHPATLAAGGGDNSVRVYREKETGVWEEAAAFVNAHDDDVNDIAWFSVPNEETEKGEDAQQSTNYFASASDDGTVKIWKFRRRGGDTND